MVDGIRVCHPVGHGCGGSRRRRVEAVGKGLRVSPNRDIKGGDCCGGGRGAIGGVNKGPTCCTGKPYWGAAKKACCAD
jgi:hypothetical protein